MGKRGPAPKPRNLKVLEGTYRPDRDPFPDVEVGPGLPVLPADWGAEAPWGKWAIKEYFALGPGLVKLGLLSPIDRAAFLGYCDAWGRWIYFRRRVQKSGSLTRRPSGILSEHPNVALMNGALNDLRTFLGLFGLSPADRSRVQVLGSGTTPSNPFTDLNR